MLLERGDVRGVVGQDGADLIEPKQESASSMQIDVKGDGSAFRQVDKLGVEVDRNWFTRGCRRDRVPVLGVV